MVQIAKYSKKEIPFTWVEYYEIDRSKAFRYEVYPRDAYTSKKRLITYLYHLFESVFDEIYPYAPEWGHITLDNSESRKTIKECNDPDLTSDTRHFLKMLIRNDIDFEYSGALKVYDWQFFLEKVLACIAVTSIEYGPLFFCPKHKFVFYIHYSRSIGLYCKEQNAFIKDFLSKAYKNYKVYDRSDEQGMPVRDKRK